MTGILANQCGSTFTPFGLGCKPHSIMISIKHHITSPFTLNEIKALETKELDHNTVILQINR